MKTVKKNNVLKKAKKGTVVKNFSKPISAEMQKGGTSSANTGAIPFKISYRPPLDKKGREALKKETARRKASAIRENKYRDSLNQIKNAKGTVR